MTLMDFRTIAQLTAGDKVLNRYKVHQISHRTDAKFVCQAQDQYDNKPVLLVFERSRGIRLYPEYMRCSFNFLSIDVGELPLAKICDTACFKDAQMIVVEDEGPLACELVNQKGKLTKNETLSICLSLLYCIKTLAEYGCALRDIRSSSVIWNTKTRIMSKALVTSYPRVFHFRRAKYVTAQLIQLVYMFFDLWATDLGDVYKYNLREIEEKHSEFSKLIGYVSTLEEKGMEPDFDMMRNLFELLIE